MKYSNERYYVIYRDDDGQYIVATQEPLDNFVKACLYLFSISSDREPKIVKEISDEV